MDEVLRTAPLSETAPLKELDDWDDFVATRYQPGKSEEQKSELADRITNDVMAVLNYGEESVSVAIEEVKPQDWTEKVYKPDILDHPEKIFKKPGYNPFE